MKRKKINKAQKAADKKNMMILGGSVALILAIIFWVSA